MKRVDIISKVIGRSGQGKPVGGGISIPMGNYALKSDFESLKSMFNDFLEGDDTDSVINRWKDLEAFLNGISEDNTLDSILKDYVTLSGTQTITGEKNFTGGLKVNGSPLVYNKESGYWKLEGDLLVTGGVSMYSNDTAFTPSTIMDAIVVDGVTIIKQDGKLVAIGGGSTGGSVADSVAWGNVIGKPSWITESAPIIGISGVNVSLGSGISQSSLRTALGLGSNAYTSTAFLPLTGGTLSDYTETPLILKGTYSENVLFHLYNKSNIATSVGKYGSYTFFANYANGNGTGELEIHDDGRLTYATGGNNYSIWHEGNFNPSNYLPLSGGTLENANGSPLRINSTHQGGSAIVFLHNGADKSWFGYDKNIGRTYMYNTASQSYLGVRDNGTPYFNSYTLWHSGNDGSGSGLDADLLDGKHNGELTALYVKSQNVITDDFSTYLNTYGNQGLSVLSNMSGADVGDIPTICAVLNIGSTATRLGRFIFMRNDQSDGLWWQSANSAYNAWGTKRKVAFVDSNVASATKLQTTRYIWGRSFDGTGNVTGDLDMGNNIIICQKDTEGNRLHSMYTSTSNNLVIGSGHASKGYSTYINGNNIHLRYGTNQTTGIELTSAGRVSIKGNVDIPNNKSIYLKDSTGTDIQMLIAQTNNDFVLGGGTCSKKYWTLIKGYKIAFYTAESGTRAMLINNSGNITIGAGDLASTSYKLYVDGAIRATKYIYSDSLLWFKQGSEGIYIGHNAICWHNNGAAWVSNLMGFESNKVTINQSTTVQGDLLSTGGITMYSARKLKTIQDERGLSLNELSTIKPTRFTWKDGRDDRTHIGGIADDVQKVLPEVIYNMDNVLCMDYGNAAFAISASLIKPVITHEEEIKVLKNRIKELEEQVKTLSWNIA